MAAADLRKALAIDPRFEPALYLYGAMRYNASDWEAADTYLRLAVNSNPHDANARWLLGLALAHTHGLIPKASSRQVRAAIRLNPSLRNPHATSELLNAAGAKCAGMVP